MNKLLSSFVIFITIILLVSCRKDKPEPEPYIDLNPTSLDFTNAPEQARVVNMVCNGDWKLETTADWMEISPKSGTGNASITILPTGNTAPDMREATITVTTKHLTETLKIRQLGEAPAILVDQNDGYLAAYGEGLFVLNITTNVKYQTLIDVDWLKEITVNQSKVMVNIQQGFTATKYTAAEPRVATVTLKQVDGELEQKITVTQLPSSPVEVIDLYISAENFANTTVINAEGAVINVNPANEMFSIKMSEPSWMKIIPIESPAAASMITKAAPAARTVLLAQNKEKLARKGEIIFYGKNGVNDTVFINQIGTQPQMVASYSNAFLPATGGSTNLSVMSNSDSEIKFTNNAKWLNVKQIGEAKKIGSSYKFSYQLSVGNNDSLQMNSTNLNFTGVKSNLSTAVTVSHRSFGKNSMYLTQKNIELSAVNSVFAVEPVFQSGTKDYIVTISHDWVKQNPSRKELFTVEANPHPYFREATIIFAQKYSQTKDTLYIKQNQLTNDNFTRHTDSLAVRAIVESLGEHFSWYRWPDNGTINDLQPIGVNTSLINGQWRVSSITLPSVITYDKTFILPSSLWTLSQLSSIEAQGPYQGEIPAEISNLRNLKKITFVYSSIQGALPKEIATLSLMEEITIKNLNFKTSSTPDKTVGITSLPTELATMKNLKQLTLVMDTPSFPTELCGIENLKYLEIMQKGLLENHAMPQNITRLRNLETFKYYSLSSTRTGASLVNDLFTLPNIKTLHICTNDVLPASVSSANGLTNLTVWGNFTQLTSSGVRLPSSIKTLDANSHKLAAVTDEMITSNLESISVNALSVNHLSSKIAQASKLHTLIWCGDEQQKCMTSFALYSLKNIKKLYFIRAKGLFTDDVLGMTGLTHLQILDSDVEGYISDKMWRFFIERLGSPLPTDDPTERLVIKNNRFNSDVKTATSQSSPWTSGGSPSTGAWSPNNNVIPQQKGYSINVMK